MTTPLENRANQSVLDALDALECALRDSQAAGYGSEVCGSLDVAIVHVKYVIDLIPELNPDAQVGGR